MKEIFTDVENWCSYSKDSNGSLWLTDYPQAEYHGRGSPRKRMITANKKTLEQLDVLLVSLGKHSNDINHHKAMAKNYLYAISYVVSSLSDGSDIHEALANAVRLIGQERLPGEWGAEIESKWTRFTNIVRATT